MLQAISYYGALALETLTGVFGIRLYEEPHYRVIERLARHVEVRAYMPRLAAEAELPIRGQSGRNEAFRVLFAYITGANRRSTGSARIAMTVPVSVREGEPIEMAAPVRTSEENGAVRMQFFLPAKYNAETAPSPKDARVRLVTIPEETIAVLRFSGSGTDVSERQSELLATLAGSPWRPTEPTYALFYDPPFTLPFLRRNEAAVAVANLSSRPAMGIGAEI
jgi:SOUL heme-binding protein